MSFLDFRNPYLLLLFIPYIIVIFLYYFRGVKNRNSAVAISSSSLINRKSSLRAKLYPYLPIVRFLSIAFLIIALARPGKSVSYTDVKNYGIDIMVALDLSGSMMAMDFQPNNRLTVAKNVLIDFIKKRKGDRVGLVVFSGDSYLQSPLTVEHNILNQIIDELDFDSVSKESGTAIGDALALSISRMMERKSASRIILLITDGVNNAGSIDPETASDLAKEMGVKIYTVGIGKDGYVSFPMPDGQIRKVKIPVDQKSLKKIAEKTGGKYFRSKSSGVLWENIKEIDQLEKSEADIRVYNDFFDKFYYFILIAAILFFIEIALRSLYFRKVP